MRKTKTKADRQDGNFLTSAHRTIKCEQSAISDMDRRIDQNFERACTLMFNCEGHIVVTGIGKSGHIARKIAATFSSTGSPALFLHPSEAGHGDMGAVMKRDMILAISYSGEAPELLTLIPLWKRMRLSLIVMSSSHESSLARAADVFLDISVKEEACSLDLAPTSSTTVSLVLGDALAIALHEAHGFDAKDFAFSHPSGTLGRRLLLTVADVMQKDSQTPKVDKQVAIADALMEMNRCGLGMTTVVDAGGGLLGVFTDGDLRRALNQRVDIHTVPVSECMTTGGHIISAKQLAIDALNIMEQHKITTLVGVDEKGHPVGVVHMHHLLAMGLT